MIRFGIVFFMLWINCMPVVHVFNSGLMQKDIFCQTQTSLLALSIDEVKEESLTYTKGVSDSVYTFQGSSPNDFEQLHASNKIMNDSLAVEHATDDDIIAPYAWKKIAKCIAGAYSGYLLGAVGGAAIGAGLITAGVATGGVGLVIGVGVIGAIGGAAGGSYFGDCWKN